MHQNCRRLQVIIIIITFLIGLLAVAIPLALASESHQISIITVYSHHKIELIRFGKTVHTYWPPAP